MSLFTRPNKYLWFFGILLLVASVAGSGWVLNSEKNNPEKENKNALDSPFGGKGIVALGYVDVEPGVANIHPLQGGTVMWVATEGTSVKKDDVLIRMDDRMAREKLSEANIAVEVARKEIAKAEKADIVLQTKIDQQEDAINVAKQQEDLQQEKINKMKEFIKNLNPETLRIEEKILKVKNTLTSVEKNKKNELIRSRELVKIEVDRAKLDLKHKQALVEQAKLNLEYYVRKAPSDGIVLRVNVAVGESVGTNPRMPALQFCPKLPRIIRAEVQQEFADGLKLGQKAVIEDDTTAKKVWNGKVVRISDWYTHKRSIILEPMQLNDVRTLECIIEVEEPEGQPLRIGQRMRVKIKQGGP